MSSTVYQIRFYTHDVVAIYLKPFTSVPGDAFADQLRSSSFLGFPSGFQSSFNVIFHFGLNLTMLVDAGLS